MSVDETLLGDGALTEGDEAFLANIRAAMVRARQEDPGCVTNQLFHGMLAAVTGYALVTSETRDEVLEVVAESLDPDGGLNQFLLVPLVPISG